jgi:hypothetical protein
MLSQIWNDSALYNTVKRLPENGLTLNLEKCEFNKDKTVFFGVTFSKKGISPDPKKVTTLKDMFHQQILQNFVVYLV